MDKRVRANTAFITINRQPLGLSYTGFTKIPFVRYHNSIFPVACSLTLRHIFRFFLFIFEFSMSIFLLTFWHRFNFNWFAFFSFLFVRRPEQREREMKQMGEHKTKKKWPQIDLTMTSHSVSIDFLFSFSIFYSSRRHWFHSRFTAVTFNTHTLRQQTHNDRNIRRLIIGSV